MLMWLQLARFSLALAWLMAAASSRAGAQAPLPRADSVLLASSVRAVAQRYQAAAPGETHLLNGAEFVEHLKAYLQGSPYFPSYDLQISEVAYDGFTFTGVPLRYDCQADQVLFFPASRAVVLRLVPQKLASFTAGGHQFVRIETDSVANPQVRAGFYDLLAEGPARLLARRTKRISERPTSTRLAGEYYEIVHYFVQQGATYTEVTRLRDVTRLFPTRRVALQRFARTRQLSFREATRERALATLLQYCNTLPSSR